MCTTARTIKCNFCKRSGRVHPCFVYMFLQTPQLWSSVSTCSDRARNKLWPSFAFAFQGGMSSFLGLGYGVIEPFRPPNPPSNSGKRFVPLIFHLFSIEGGARHPWQLSAIATAIATWLGALSRSHGTRAHHKGGANSGEVQKTAQGERKGCTRTWKTNAPRAHRVVHRAHRAYISLLYSGLGLLLAPQNMPLC